MRIWKVNPKKLCKKHLLGEHVECHMFAGSINKKKSIEGHIKKGQIEVHNLKRRHQELAEELKNRNYNHNSPLQKFKAYKIGKINKKENLKELAERCENCKKLIIKNIK